jgi:hypothetical protein
MKKFIFLIAFGLLGVAANAQIYDMLATTGNTSDTVTNTSAETLTKQVSGAFSQVTVQLTVTKIGGTVAGTSVLQGSIDGTNYVTLTSHYADPGDTANSVTNTNVATQSWIWDVGNSKYLYYRVTTTGSGTMTAKVQAKIMVRK